MTTNKKYVETLNQWIDDNHIDHRKVTEDYFKNAKRAVFEPHVVPKKPSTTDLIKGLCEVFRVDYELALILLQTGERQVLPEIKVEALKQFLHALLRAKGNRIAGFCQLKIQKLEPPNFLAKIKKLVADYSVEIDLDSLIQTPFVPRQLICAPETRDMVNRLLRQIIVDGRGKDEEAWKWKDSRDYEHWETCRNVLFQKQIKGHAPKNPAQLRVLKSFCQAFAQGQITNRSDHSDRYIISRLRRLGMNHSLFYRLKGSKFSAHDIPETPLNRQSIKKFCKALDIEGSYHIAANLLLETKITTVNKGDDHV
jgi:hypothetical protein